MDIVNRLRATRATMLGTNDEQHYSDVHAAADEIEKLRAWQNEAAAAMALFITMGATPDIGAWANNADRAIGLLNMKMPNVELTGGAPGGNNRETLPDRRPVERRVGGK